jgi:predicted permease
MLMNPFRELVAGLRSLLRRTEAESDLDDEVRHYLEMAAQERVRSGMSPADAERAARVDIGGVEAVKEEVRWIGWEATVETFVRDLRYAIRRLRQSPGFTIVAVVSLALGIGANTAIFSLVNATLIQNLPVRNSDELVYIHGSSASQVFSYPDFNEIRRYNTAFDGVIGWGGVTVSMGSGEDVALTSGAIVTGNYFDVLGVHAAIGRTITDADDMTPDAHPVVVIGDRLWQRRFNRDPSVVGKDVMINGRRFSIIGVMPRGFEGAQLGTVRDFFVPMMMQAVIRPPRGGYSGEMNPDLLHTRGNRWLFALGRLKPGVTISAATASLAGMLKEQQARDASDERNMSVTLTPVDDGDVDSRPQMVSAAKLLMSVVGLVLLIACANVANLLLARSTSRAREIAVRLSLGASRGRLVRQLLTESVLLASVGGLAGLALAWLTIHAFLASPPPVEALPMVVTFSIDSRVLVFTLLLSIATGVVFGLMPALRASRPELAPTLKDESFTARQQPRRVNVRSVLVVAQVAMSLLVLVSASLFLRSLRESQAVTPGFDAKRVLTVPLSINLLRYTKAQGRQFYEQVVGRVKAMPGVESASLTRWVPLSGNNAVRGLMIQGLDAKEQLLRSENGGSGRGNPNATFVQVIGNEYFRTMGIRLVRGRDFTVADLPDGGPVVIINEAFAHAHFPNVDPIGQRLSVNGRNGPWAEIVGVAADSKMMRVAELPIPNVYLPLAQNHETGMTLLVRTSVDPRALAPSIAREVHAIEKNLPAANARSLSEWVDLSLYLSRAGTVALVVFGALAVLLASVGLYGVMSYAVARRTKELGVRMALGATAGDVLGQILREGIALVVAGVLVGLLAAYGATNLLASFLYGVSPRDVVSFTAVPGLLVLVGVLACYLPARRATRVDPMTALRHQ